MIGTGIRTDFGTPSGTERATVANGDGQYIGVSLLLSAVIDRILTLKVLACSIWMLENSNKLDFTSNYMREHLDTTKCFLHHQKQEIPKWAQHDLGRNMR